MTAMIRNLGKMSAIGLFDKKSSHVKHVCEQLVNSDALHQARLHPYTVLQALCTYSKGRGEKGSLSWEVNEKIKQALDSAFYLAFKVCAVSCACYIHCCVLFVVVVVVLLMFIIIRVVV